MLLDLQHCKRSAVLVFYRTFRVAVEGLKVSVQILSSEKPVSLDWLIIVFISCCLQFVESSCGMSAHKECLGKAKDMAGTALRLAVVSPTLCYIAVAFARVLKIACFAKPAVD